MEIKKEGLDWLKQQQVEWKIRKNRWPEAYHQSHIVREPFVVVVASQLTRERQGKRGFGESNANWPLWVAGVSSLLFLLCSFLFLRFILINCRRVFIQLLLSFKGIEILSWNGTGVLGCWGQEPRISFCQLPFRNRNKSITITLQALLLASYFLWSLATACDRLRLSVWSPPRRPYWTRADCATVYGTLMVVTLWPVCRFFFSLIII